MRRYETTYILRPNLGEEQFSEIIDRTNAIVTNDGGSVINLERLGNRKLAYEIKKEILGQYVYFDFAAPGSTIQEMERIFRIDDRVLRFLTVKLEDSIDEQTIASETERAEAIAAEKSSAETEAEAAEAKSETPKDAATEAEAPEAEAPEAEAPEAEAPEAEAPEADTPEADQAESEEAKKE